MLKFQIDNTQQTHNLIGIGDSELCLVFPGLCREVVDTHDGGSKE